MEPTKHVLKFYIASSCSDRKSSTNIRAGWFAVLRSGSCRIEFHRPLCLECDNGRQTNLRALLRCLTFIATATHELAKTGMREVDNFALCDARPLGFGNMTVEVFTSEKTELLAKLSRGYYKAHEDLHRTIQEISTCLKQIGISLRVGSVSQEEESMKYAVASANYAHEDGASAYCVTCDFRCGGDFSQMIEHLKADHMNRNPNEEAGRVADFAGRHAWSICGKCATAFLDAEELLEHRRNFQCR